MFYANVVHLYVAIFWRWHKHLKVKAGQVLLHLPVWLEGFSLFLFISHPPLQSCLLCAAVPKVVWKDTADWRRRRVGVRYVRAWGNQVLWSVMLCPPSWWSKTGITATDDHGGEPSQMHNVGYDVSRDELYERQCQLEKCYYYWLHNTEHPPNTE